MTITTPNLNSLNTNTEVHSADEALSHFRDSAKSSMALSTANKSFTCQAYGHFLGGFNA